MKVIAYNGSPRLEGNTSLLIKMVFNELNKQGIETKEINVGHNAVLGCVGCGGCKREKNNTCIAYEDVFNNYYAEVLDADGIILASPVYYADITGQMKSFIDRFATVGRANGTLKGKVGASIVAARRDGAFHAYSTLNAVFGVSEMINVGSTYWNYGMGRMVGDVNDDAEGIKTMVNLGKNMAEALIKLHK